MDCSAWMHARSITEKAQFLSTFCCTIKQNHLPKVLVMMLNKCEQSMKPYKARESFILSGIHVYQQAVIL